MRLAERRIRSDIPPGQEKAAVIHISPDGKQATFNPQTDFLDMPGGAKKFTVRYDPASKHYWTLASVVGDEFKKLKPAKVRNTLALVGAGIVIGGAGALAATRVLTDFLFEVKPGDPQIFALVALTLVAAAIMACYVPARRAMRVDPMVALRHE